MVNNRFVLYQVKREIKRNGTEMTFMRGVKNEYGEPGEPIVLCTYKGMYHEHAAHMLDTYRLLTGDTNALRRTEKTPQLIVPYEDFYFKKSEQPEEYDSVRVGDYVMFNGRMLKVTGILNVQEWNLLMDISFEEVDEGESTGYPS